MAINHLGLGLNGRRPFESSTIGVQCNVTVKDFDMGLAILPKKAKWSAIHIAIICGCFPCDIDNTIC